MNERRAENRMLCADLFEVCWADESGKPCSVMANLEEISIRRAHLVMDTPVPVGSEIVLRMKHIDVVAAVLECRQEPDFGYAVSAQLLRRSRWRLHPRHMFDPRGIAAREAARNQVR